MPLQKACLRIFNFFKRWAIAFHTKRVNIMAMCDTSTFFSRLFFSVPFRSSISSEITNRNVLGWGEMKRKSQNTLQMSIIILSM